MPIAHLTDRAIISVSGEEARAWLNNLVTCDVATLTPGEGRWGALLTPQGKIIVDFIVAQDQNGERFLLDAPRALAGDLIKRLRLYKLRAKIDIVDLSDDGAAEPQAVAAIWGEGGAPAGDDTLRFRDLRHPALGERIIMERNDAGALTESEARYHTHRIALGVPEGGKDFVYGDTFPHEANMDQLGAIDFRKGCYVGQEVVSRMQHRGSGGRARIVPVVYDGGFAATEGVEVKAGDRVVGSTGSHADGRGLAKLRLDRVEDALRAGEPLTAGGIAITLVKPDWARFRFPGEAEASPAV